MIIDKNYFQNMTQNQLNEELMAAVFSKDLELIKYLLTSTELTTNASLYMNENCDTNPFLHTCAFGDVSIVKYLTSQLDFKHKNIDKALTYNGQTPLIVSAYYGQIEVMNYLINEPEFEKYNDFSWLDNAGRNIFIRVARI